MNQFWKKVNNCVHEWGSDYYVSGSCDTPYCNWTEVKCKKCKVYHTSCPCGFNIGESGWSYRRLLKQENI